MSSPDKTTVILIRGLFREKRHWGDFPDMLANQGAIGKVLCVEIPGNGELHKLKTPASVNGMVEAIRQQLAGEQSYVLVGLSMGGMIALQWAKNHPQEVQTVICINSSNAAFSAFYERLRPEKYLSIITALLQKPAKRELNIMKLVSNHPVQHQKLENWIRYAQQFPTSPLNFVRQLWAAGRFKMENAPHCKLLFITSENDQLVNSKSQSAMARQWHAMEIINQVDGHDIALDNPEWLCQAITRYLDNID